jgi:hypothetical protein
MTLSVLTTSEALPNSCGSGPASSRTAASSTSAGGGVAACCGGVAVMVVVVVVVLLLLLLLVTRFHMPAARQQLRAPLRHPTPVSVE